MSRRRPQSGSINLEDQYAEMVVERQRERRARLAAAYEADAAEDEEDMIAEEPSPVRGRSAAASAASGTAAQATAPKAAQTAKPAVYPASASTAAAAPKAVQSKGQVAAADKAANVNPQNAVSGSVAAQKAQQIPAQKLPSAGSIQTQQAATQKTAAVGTQQAGASGIQPVAAQKTAAPSEVRQQPAQKMTSTNTLQPASGSSRAALMQFGLTPKLPYSVEEAVNRLRINISFLGDDMRRILVVSSEPNEGKSFVALNLWNQMAEAGEQTILLDADLRNSTLYSKYKLYREDGRDMKGTSHYLSGNAGLADVLMHTKYGQGYIMPNIENVINPSLLLETDKFKNLMESLSTMFSYVFVDAPPLGLVSDAEKIGSLCDGAILCVRSGVTPKGIVRESINQLNRAGCPLIGIVLNRVDESKGGYGYGRYGRYGKYGKYGHYGKYGGYYGKYYGDGSED